MIKNRKVIAAVLLLGIAPFARGCSSGITYGFPIPVEIKDVFSFIILGVNLLLLVWLARYFARISFFLNALLVNLCLAWSVLLVDYFQPLLNIYYYYIYYVPFWIYQKTPYYGGRGKPGQEIAMDILIRIWFIVITILLSRLFYLVSGRFKKLQPKA